MIGTEIENHKVGGEEGNEKNKRGRKGLVLGDCDFPLLASPAPSSHPYSIPSFSIKISTILFLSPSILFK